MPATAKVWTEAELMAASHDGHKCELVDGELVMSPAGVFDHGNIIARILTRLTMHAVYDRRLGEVFDGQSGHWMKSGNMRCPDISFWSKARLDALPSKPKGFIHGAPDLAVEVLSPSDTVNDMAEKLSDYFASGARLVWVVNPQEKSVLIYHETTPERLLRSGDMIDGEDVVPGFSMPVSELFAELSFV